MVEGRSELKNRGNKPGSGGTVTVPFGSVEMLKSVPVDGSERTREPQRDIGSEPRGEWSTEFARGGATCPRCKCGRTRIRTSRPEENGLKVRYHVCPICKVRFKSIEVV
jgi:hypothetical protein